MLATTYGVGQVVYTILWLCLFFLEIWFSISIFIDIFRSHDLKGWQKALWVLLVLLVPIIGIIAYFIFRGDKMRVHQQQATQQYQDSVRDDSRHVGDSGGTPTEQLSRLADLKREGVISEEEFQHLKSDIMKRVSDKGDQ
jgi:hypothetical protein